MSQPVFFSVIIPTYNRAHLILHTLQTVFEQSFRDFEVIVIDNASQDGTAQLLAPFVDKGMVKLIVQGKNHERARSRNTGQQVARGQYVTFLDSDDFMYPDNLKDAYSYAVNHPDVHLFHNLYEMVDSDRKVVYQYPFKPLKNPLREIARGNFLSCIGVFIHHNIYKSVAWDETPILIGSEDYEYWLRSIAMVRTVGRIEKVNSAILHHPDRTMNQMNLEIAEKRITYLLAKIKNDPELFLCYRPYFPEMRSTLFIFLAGLAQKTDRAMTLHYLMKAFGSNWLVLKATSFYSIFFHLIAGSNRTSKR